MTTKETNHEFEALLDFLKRKRGFDFTGYKRASLMRRVKKRMYEVGIREYLAYLDFLEDNPDEFTLLFNTILINVTTFFRDMESWESLTAEVIPEIARKANETGLVRVWCPGCSSGEEAYTLAIILSEALGEEMFIEQVKIYATDADEEALNKARQGRYTSKETENIPGLLLEKYFDKQADGFSFRKDLRRVLIFGRHDLVQNAPISRIDLITCRNVLMYFDSKTQAQVLARLHFALNEGGFIFLGKAEMLLSYANAFSPENLRYRIFKKVSTVNFRDRITAMSPSSFPRGMNANQVQNQIIENLFDINYNAQFVINQEGNLAMANQQARDLFSLRVKEYGQPFQNMEVSYRPVDLRTPLSKVLNELAPQTINEVELMLTTGERRYYEVRLVPLIAPDRNVLGASITFIDVTTHKNLFQQLEHTNQELETAMEELQSTNEELETTNEELQSTIEELETTNEELQSANEELETMNEELQSTNQEMEAINDQLHERNDAFNQVNAFLNAILESISGSIIVLDPQLRVIIWSQKAEDLWGLRSSEVQNQHFLNLDIGLPIEKLTKPIRQAISELNSKEEIELVAHNRRGKEVTCKVVITPLVGSPGKINGVIHIIEGVNGFSPEIEQPQLGHTGGLHNDGEEG